MSFIEVEAMASGSQEDEAEAHPPRRDWPETVAIALIFLTVGLFGGIIVEKNMAHKTPVIQNLHIDESNMREPVHVQALLDRYTQEAQKAEGRYVAQTGKDLTPQQKEIHKWLEQVAKHPCAMPEDMMRIHADAVMRASAALVVVQEGR